MCESLNLMPLQTDNHWLPATEGRKHQTYEQRVRKIEHSSFTPIVLSRTEGLGKAATMCYNRLASMIAAKQDLPFSSTISWIRFLLSLSLLRSAIQCIRGARSACGRVAKQPVIAADQVSSGQGFPDVEQQSFLRKCALYFCASILIFLYCTCTVKVVSRARRVYTSTRTH